MTTTGTCILCDRQNVEVQQACTSCLVGLDGFPWQDFCNKCDTHETEDDEA